MGWSANFLFIFDADVMFHSGKIQLLKDCVICSVADPDFELRRGPGLSLLAGGGPPLDPPLLFLVHHD